MFPWPVSQWQIGKVKWWLYSPHDTYVRPWESLINLSKQTTYQPTMLNDFVHWDPYQCHETSCRKVRVLTPTQTRDSLFTFRLPTLSTTKCSTEVRLIFFLTGGRGTGPLLFADFLRGADTPGNPLFVEERSVSHTGHRRLVLKSGSSQESHLYCRVNKFRQDLPPEPRRTRCTKSKDMVR